MSIHSSEATPAANGQPSDRPRIPAEGPDVSAGASGGSPSADASRRPSPTSDGSNKAPAKRGGGPRTAAGKRASSKNAQKHGLWSQDPTAGGESKEEWEARLEAFRDDVRPEGAVQEAVVYCFALAFQRKLRVINYEAALINLHYEALRPPTSRHPRTWEDRALDKVDCDVAEAVSFLGFLEDLGDSVALETPDVVNALFLVALVCTNGPLPEWAVFPTDGDAWTSSDVRRWMSALGQHLDTTGEDLRRDAMAKGSAILVARRERRAAELQRTSQALFRDSDQFQLILKADESCDRAMARSVKQIEVLQTARRGDLPPPQRLEVYVES